MMRVAYIILAHSHPENVARLAIRLTESGGVAAVHYDLKSPAVEFAAIETGLKSTPAALLVPRIEVGWGQWSIVQATLNAIQALEATEIPFDYVHLMSGADYPIRPLSWFDRFLSKSAGKEFIEATNIRKGTWIKDGLEHERYQYRHIHNWQTDPIKFDRYWKRQQNRKQKREFLKGLDPFLGAQWWTLTWNTCRQARGWSETPGVRQFFETVWIPDEMFFQTYVGNNISSADIANSSVCLYQFDDNGKPVVYYDDHLDYLTRQKFFFARKLSPGAQKLRDGIDAELERLRQAKVPFDGGLGKPTSEYAETIESHRWGLANRWRVGYAVDAWYGDLEWNRNHYIVVATSSRAAAEPLIQALAAPSFTICHGELFAARGIEFASGRQRFAGYGIDDIALRDQKRTNFLVDVIKAGAPALTCFVVVLDGSNDPLGVLIWDQRAHFVLLQLGVVEAFLESRCVATRSAADVADERTEFILFANQFLARSGREWSELRDKLAKAGKRPFVIDAYGGAWHEEMRQFALTIWQKNGTGSLSMPLPAIKVEAAFRSGERRIEDPARILRLAAAIADAAERDRNLLHHFAPAMSKGERYIVATTWGPLERWLIDLLKQVFSDLHWVVFGCSAPPDQAPPPETTVDPSGEPRSTPLGIGDVWSIECGPLRSDAIEPAFGRLLLHALVADPRSEVLWGIDIADPLWFVQFVAFARRAAESAGNRADRIAEVLRKTLEAAPADAAAHGGSASALCDLRWGVEPYLVVAAASRVAAAPVVDALAGCGFVSCHGELFAADRIEYAAALRRRAGYRDDDLAARDRRPLHFLTDLVKAGWPALTAFVLVLGKERPLTEALLNDPRARFIVAGVDIVDAFISETRHAAGPDDPAGPMAQHTEAARVALFYEALQAADARRRSALLRRLAETGKRFLSIEPMEEGWVGRLMSFVEEIAGSRVHAAAPFPSSSTLPVKREPFFHYNHARVLELIQVVSDAKERERLLQHYFKISSDNIKGFIVAFVLSKADENLVETLPAAIPQLDWATIRFAPSMPPLSSAGAAVATGRTGSCSVRSPRYRSDGVSLAGLSSVLHMLFADPRCRILLVRGNLFAALADLLGTDASCCEPLAGRLELLSVGGEAFLGRVRALATAHARPYRELDLLAADWFAELIAFVNPLLPDGPLPPQNREAIAERLVAALREAPDPAAAFDDALELTTAILPLSRRLAHQRALRGGGARPPRSGKSG
jgi:hypothetical protein